ncbi:hypothetical protein WJU23_00790 [Prosthecobacter sp. SYSU 5D2]|uniref:hypothetical protein n=1 Tax=Prosthecobacter sp. SYSU 5D2 TaxID=3134134 RepID=UPI0031FF025B
MDEATLTEPRVNESSWRRLNKDLKVTFVWAYDTVAILPEYDDSEPGILPSGQLIKFSESAEFEGHYLCDLDNPTFVESVALPEGRIHRFRPWCFATVLQAVISAEDYHQGTAEAARPAWFKRVIRRILHG